MEMSERVNWERVIDLPRWPVQGWPAGGYLGRLSEFLTVQIKVACYEQCFAADDGWQDVKVLVQLLLDGRVAFEHISYL